MATYQKWEEIVKRWKHEFGPCEIQLPVPVVLSPVKEFKDRLRIQKYKCKKKADKLDMKAWPTLIMFEQIPSWHTSQTYKYRPALPRRHGAVRR